VSQVACDLGIAAVVGARWGRPARRVYLLLGLAFLPYPFPYLRVDLVAVLLATAALALMTRRSARWLGGALLAVAVLAKVWPLALAPALLRRDRRAALLAFGATGLALGGAWWLVAGAAGPAQVLSFRSAEGWQVESIAGSLRHLIDPSGLRLESGAFRTGVMPGFARPLLSGLGAAVVAGAWLAARRTADHPVSGARADTDAALAAVSAVLVFAPILSPQYVLWLLPFAAVVTAGGDRLVGWLTALTMGLTTLSCALVGAVATGWRAATAVVVGRNAVLVALLVVALQRVAGVRATPQGQSQLRRRKYRYSEPVEPNMSARAKG
jgi:membrane protein YdbS with pleckstrin-like domain